MKCPVCGEAEIVHDTRDLPYTYKGKTTAIPAVTADFCPACDESITDMTETERVMREMDAFNKRVNFEQDLTTNVEALVPRLIPNRPASEMAQHPALNRSLDKFSPVYFHACVTERNKHIADYGFVLISKESGKALADLLSGRKCLDAGAGTGWLSFVLSEHGVNVTASELFVEKNNFGFKKIWRNDHVGDSATLLPGDFDAVLLAWPNYESDFGLNVIQAMTSGQMLIYQGEGMGGCTGNDAMFELLHDESQWKRDRKAEDILNAHHLKFEAIHDSWWVYFKI